VVRSVKKEGGKGRKSKKKEGKKQKKRKERRNRLLMETTERKVLTSR